MPHQVARKFFFFGKERQAFGRFEGGGGGLGWGGGGGRGGDGEGGGVNADPYGDFPKLGVPFLGVPIIRTIVFWGLS